MCWDESPKKVNKTAAAGKSTWPGKTRRDAYGCAWIVAGDNVGSARESGRRVREPGRAWVGSPLAGRHLQEPVPLGMPNGYGGRSDGAAAQGNRARMPVFKPAGR